MVLKKIRVSEKRLTKRYKLALKNTADPVKRNKMVREYARMVRIMYSPAKLQEAQLYFGGF